MAIPWVPILSAGATLIGSLFGNSKSQSQTENSATNSSQADVGQQSLDSTTNQTSTQNQTSSQTSNQSSAEQVGTTQQQTGNTTRLDDDTLGALTQAVQSAIAGGTVGAGSQAARERLEQVQNDVNAFDADGYVAGIMTAARSRIDSDLDSGRNKVLGLSGASGRSNSAAALLEQKLNREGAAELAGIESKARADATSINAARSGEITNLAAQTDAQIGNMLGALLQARESSTQVGTGTQNTTGSTAGSTTGSTQTQSTVNEVSSQDQTSKNVSTGASTTVGNIKANSGSTNWSDFFSKIGQMFSADF